MTAPALPLWPRSRPCYDWGVSPILINDGGERRSDRRYKVSFRVHWGRGESDEYSGEVSDLSAGGCFVESGEQVSEGDLVKLRIDVPGHDDLTIWGHVVFWVRATGFGVRFTAFSQGGARDMLVAIIDEEERRP